MSRMRWTRGTHEAQIRTADGAYVINKEAPDSFSVWGPEGSQDVDYIRTHTAARIRELMQRECRAGDLQVVAGRGLIGFFVSPEEARAAVDADVSRGTHQRGAA